jgi:hypothetical protein
MLFGLAGYLAIVLLPGAWFGFGLPLKCLSFWARCGLAIALSPLVVAAQFYLLRLAGLILDSTVPTLIVLNLPASMLILRSFKSRTWPDRHVVGATGIVSLVLLASIAPFLLNPQLRVYTWENFMHTDIVYALADGHLVPQDAELAGVTVSYPSVGHAIQTVLSYSLGTSPSSNYIWTNLIWEVVTLVLASEIVGVFGGRGMTRLMGAVWLALGVNVVGFSIAQMLPTETVQAYASLSVILGDNRYTPWLDKVMLFNQMPFALALLAACAVLTPRLLTHGVEIADAAALFLIWLSLALIYPVLLPTSLALAVGLTLLWLTDGSLELRRRLRWSGTLLALAALAFLICLIYTRYLTLDRQSAQLFMLNTPRRMLLNSVASLIVLSPLLIGAWLYVLSRRPKDRRLFTLMAITAMINIVPYILFEIPWYRNEYKFVFTTAIYLSPFPALVMQPLFDRLGRTSVLLVGGLAVLLSSQLVYNVYLNADPQYMRAGPPADVDEFSLRLSPDQRYAELCDVVRDRTPASTVLVLRNAELYFPSLTRRQLYAPPRERAPHPGVLVTSEEMLTLVKGYPRQLLEERRGVVNALYDGPEPNQRQQALERLASLQRPIAIILDEESDQALSSWISGRGLGTLVYRGDGAVLWLVEHPESAMASGELPG